MISFAIRLAILLFFPLLTLAAKQATGLGMVAQNMLEPVGLMSDFVHSACFLIGGSFIFASIVKYIEHRRSPLMVPISTVIFLLIAGIVLVLLPFTSHFAPAGVHYSLLSFLEKAADA
jgi:hypothetical protein